MSAADARFSRASSGAHLAGKPRLRGILRRQTGHAVGWAAAADQRLLIKAATTALQISGRRDQSTGTSRRRRAVRRHTGVHFKNRPVPAAEPSHQLRQLRTNSVYLCPVERIAAVKQPTRPGATSGATTFSGIDVRHSSIELNSITWLPTTTQGGRGAGKQREGRSVYGTNYPLRRRRCRWANVDYPCSWPYRAAARCSPLTGPRHAVQPNIKPVCYNLRIRPSRCIRVRPEYISCGVHMTAARASEAARFASDSERKECEIKSSAGEVKQHSLRSSRSDYLVASRNCSASELGAKVLDFSPP